MDKFEVGDIVFIKQAEQIKKLRLERENEEGFLLKDGLFFNYKMFDYCGEKFKIRKKDKTSWGYLYYLEILKDKDKPILNWVWSDLCLEKNGIQLEFDF